MRYWQGPQISRDWLAACLRNGTAKNRASQDGLDAHSTPMPGLHRAAMTADAKYSLRSPDRPPYLCTLRGKGERVRYWGIHVTLLQRYRRLSLWQRLAVLGISPISILSLALAFTQPASTETPVIKSIVQNGEQMAGTINNNRPVYSSILNNNVPSEVPENKQNFSNRALSPPYSPSNPPGVYIGPHASGVTFGESHIEGGMVVEGRDVGVTGSHILGPNTPIPAFPDIRGEFKRLTNRELMSQSISVAQQMRALSARYEKIGNAFFYSIKH